MSGNIMCDSYNRAALQTQNMQYFLSSKVEARKKSREMWTLLRNWAVYLILTHFQASTAKRLLEMFCGQDCSHLLLKQLKTTLIYDLSVTRAY